MDLEQLRRDLSGSLLRETQHKLLIRGQYHDAEEDVSFNTREQLVTGHGIVLKFHGRIPLKNGKEHWCWNFCELSKKDVRRLIRWLIEKEKSLK